MLKPVFLELILSLVLVSHKIEAYDLLIQSVLLVPECYFG